MFLLERNEKANDGHLGIMKHSNIHYLQRDLKQS